MRLRGFLFSAIVVAAMSASDDSFASVAGAAQFIGRLGTEAITTLRASGRTLEQREARLRGLLRSDFDLPLIGRFVLGKHWRRATPEQRSDYTALFSEYVLTTYTARLGGYAGDSLTVLGARPAGQKDAVVRTRIDRPSGPPIIADWRVRIIGERYRIIDVVVEGISMAITQRSEFGAVIKRHGIEGLLAVLRARTTKLPATASLK